MVKLVRDGNDVGAPDRATDPACPVPAGGLAPGTYTFRLVPGIAKGNSDSWLDAAGVDLTLTLEAGLSVYKFEADPEPNDDQGQHPASLQIETGKKVKLNWSTTGATQVLITATPDGGTATTLDPQPVDASGQGSLVVDPQDQPTSYTIVAQNGDAQSPPSSAVTVAFHAPGQAVSPHAGVQGQLSANLAVYAFDEAADKARAKLMIGAQDNVHLQWSVTGAKTARLEAKLLVDKNLSQDVEQSEKAAEGMISNLSLVLKGLDLKVDDQGNGSGTVTLDPGVEDSTRYTLTATPTDDKAQPATATAEVGVHNFNFQVLIADESDSSKEVPAVNRKCSLELPDVGKYEGTTDEVGELWLSVPNVHVPSATLFVFDKDGKEQIASYPLKIDPEAGLGSSGTPDASSDAAPTNSTTAPPASSADGSGGTDGSSP